MSTTSAVQNIPLKGKNNGKSLAAIKAASTAAVTAAPKRVKRTPKNVGGLMPATPEPVATAPTPRVKRTPANVGGLMPATPAAKMGQSAQSAIALGQAMASGTPKPRMGKPPITLKGGKLYSHAKAEANAALVAARAQSRSVAKNYGSTVKAHKLLDKSAAKAAAKLVRVNGTPALYGSKDEWQKAVTLAKQANAAAQGALKSCSAEWKSIGKELEQARKAEAKALEAVKQVEAAKAAALAKK